MSIEARRESTGIRNLSIAGMIAIAVIHLLDTPDKLAETPYLGWLYIGLIIAATATAFALYAHYQFQRAWIASAVLAGSTFAGYCLSRTTGLPRSTEDIGNWTEPLGIASLIIEAAIVILAITQLRAKQ